MRVPPNHAELRIVLRREEATDVCHLDQMIEAIGMIRAGKVGDVDVFASSWYR